MIINFITKDAAKIFNGESQRSFPADIVRTVRRKLVQLNAVGKIGDLREPPGNRLEKLRGDREGQYSIRVNDRYRVCFTWRLTAEASENEGEAQTGNACDVELVDYH